MSTNTLSVVDMVIEVAFRISFGCEAREKPLRRLLYDGTGLAPTEHLAWQTLRRLKERGVVSYKEEELGGIEQAEYEGSVALEKDAFEDSRARGRFLLDELQAKSPLGDKDETRDLRAFYEEMILAELWVFTQKQAAIAGVRVIGSYRHRDVLRTINKTTSLGEMSYGIKQVLSVMSDSGNRANVIHMKKLLQMAILAKNFYEASGINFPAVEEYRAAGTWSQLSVVFFGVLCGINDWETDDLLPLKLGWQEYYE